MALWTLGQSEIGHFLELSTNPGLAVLFSEAEMTASWQDNKTVIQCNENMLDYALGRSTNCKFLNAPATDMVFKVLNTRRIGVHNFRLESIKDAGSEEQGISSEEAVCKESNINLCISLWGKSKTFNPDTKGSKQK